MEKRLREISNSFKRMSRKIKLIALLDVAQKEYEREDLKSGMEALKKAYEIDSKNPVVLRGFGCFRQSEGKFDKALAWYFKALKFSQAKEIEYTLIGTVYYLEDNLDEALKYFNLAIDENDDYEKAYEGRNQAMLEEHLKIVELQEVLKKYF